MDRCITARSSSLRIYHYDSQERLGEAESREKDKDKGLIQTVYEYFTRPWSPGTSDAQKLGFAYVYGTDGTLLGEYGMGGNNSSGTTQYLYLPTANGPMPIAAIVNGTAYAIHSDHLNTPRKLTQSDGQVAWQWAYSAFGDEQPTLGAKRFTNETTTPTTGSTSIPEVTFNLRYPGQYYDKESNLHYNYFRSYSAERGRYTQADPIGLDGGFNRFGYVEGNALTYTDPLGLAADGHHWVIGPIRNDPNLSPVAAQVFKDARTGPIPGGHNFGEGHSAYNKGVKDLWTTYLNEAKCNPATMTKQQAEDFVSRVKTSDDPRVRNFNRRIYEKFIRAGFRRMPPTVRGIE